MSYFLNSKIIRNRFKVKGQGQMLPKSNHFYGSP